LTLQISTPAEPVDVLDALVERARSAAGLVTR
jgi:hypothetical protein